MSVVIKGLLGISAICSLILFVKVLLSLIDFFQRGLFKKADRKGTRHRSFKSKLLGGTFYLIGAVWTLRLAVGLFAAGHPLDGVPPLAPFEEILNSMVHTLQTFSLDEDYTTYITAGRNMMADLFGEGSLLIGIYGGYAAVLNVLVPIAGGAIVFELISEFSPMVRLFFSNFRFWTEKYYFSKLNDNSLALAKSILATRKRSVCIVFADVYTDEEDENGSERLAEAKRMGAICLKDDLLHIKIQDRSPKIFLIDGTENSNLQSLTALLESSDKKIKKSEIYVFATDKAFSRLDEEVAFIVNGAKNAAEARLAGSKKDIPTVIPVNGVRNMVTNLFMDVPLFEPIIGKAPDDSGKRTVTVTILGSGVIGTEFFLTTYWFGQMLDCKLHINVISKEQRRKEKQSGEKQNEKSAYRGVGDFEGRINHINPDIFKTAAEDSDLLKYTADGALAEPYFTYEYMESDVTSDDFLSIMRKPNLLNTDYFIVALGSDEENFAVANRLRQIVGTHHLYDAPRSKTVIGYVIYNSELCRALNKDSKRKYSREKEEKDFYDIYMHAFGCLEDVYSVKNIFFDGLVDAAGDVDELFELQNRDPRETSGDEAGRFRDIYNYQASLAKMFHRKYREFSAGFHKVSIFAADGEKDYKAIEDAYLEFVVCRKKSPEEMEILHKLAWLEHRRWCAYMRTIGYRRPEPVKQEDKAASKGGERDGYELYLSLETPEHERNDHKFVALKLHPCLVECSKKGVQAEFDAYGFVVEGTDLTKKIINDPLDQLSWDCKAFNSSRGDFKIWDYPEKELSKAEKEEYMKRRKQSADA